MRYDWEKSRISNDFQVLTSLFNKIMAQSTIKVIIFL
uniref:Uncharacterized protein n=1 Tax=Heterorhabditis bacteriophora TaxID=37862 RepID=A0A1I7X331_HETBA